MSNVTALKPSARDLLAGIKIIDVDTHLTEWPELWTERAPAAWKNRMPRIVGKGAERRWVIDEDTFIYNSGAAAAVMKDGSKTRGVDFIMTEIPEVHVASYDVPARVKMMDEQGIHAQIAYPKTSWPDSAAAGSGDQRRHRDDQAHLPDRLDPSAAEERMRRGAHGRDLLYATRK
jgi:hypothetical protein